MKKVLFFSFILSAAGLFAAESEPLYKFEMNFETPIKRGYAPNTNNKIFLAPPNNFRYDDSGTKARSGKGAIALKQGEMLTMDSRSLKPGKTYTMTAWARTDVPGVAAVIRFNWFDGPGVFKSDTGTVRLTNTEWTKITKTIKAPEKFKHVYFLLYGGTKTDEVWFDDFSVVEE